MPETRNAVSQRLEAIREARGFSTLKEFHAALVERSGARVSYEATRNYHYDRTPPLEYVVAVSKAFDVDLHYLATGSPTPVRQAAEDGGEVWDLWYMLRSTVSFQIQEELFEGAVPGHLMFDSRIDTTLWRVCTLLTNISVAYDLGPRAKKVLARLERKTGERLPIYVELTEELESIGTLVGEIIRGPLRSLPLAGVKPSEGDYREYVTFMLLAIEALLQNPHDEAVRRLPSNAIGELMPSREDFQRLVERRVKRMEGLDAKVAVPDKF